MSDKTYKTLFAAVWWAAVGSMATIYFYEELPLREGAYSMTYRICPRCFEKYQTKAGWIDRTEPVGTETRDIRVRGKPSPEGKQRFYNETIKLEIRACVCGGQMYNDGLSPGDQHFLDMTK